MVQSVRTPRISQSGREIPENLDPKLEALVRDIIGRVADKWTMMIIEVLDENGTCRFSEIGRHIPGISQKMLTQTLREMEREGFVTRVVYPVIPPKVEYSLTELGLSLGAAFCGVWEWAEARHADIEAAREAFRQRNGEG